MPSQPRLVTQAAQSTPSDPPFFLTGKVLSSHLPLLGANEKWAENALQTGILEQT